ncbi:DUF3617 family protein [Novosphingobium sp.]|uniref:DUF3617 domain-containing protein n=1 Tax=Novosphingobium sp. TaxID=1874826 RepID=UPI00286E6B73|nr:DUF3617 family protein [Novosphingobium sp.]
MQSVQRGCIGIATLLLAGCGSDAANEAPVDMEPGAYLVDFKAPMFGADISKTIDGKRCITGDPEYVPTKLVRSYISLAPECATAKFERKGNQLTGSVTCPLDPQRATGKAIVTFDGTIAETSLSGTMKIDMQITASQDPQAQAAAALMSKVPIPFRAERTGDCLN